MCSAKPSLAPLRNGGADFHINDVTTLVRRLAVLGFVSFIALMGLPFFSADGEEGGAVVFAWVYHFSRPDSSSPVYRCRMVLWPRAKRSAIPVKHIR
jgi:hypothetical protein